MHVCVKTSKIKGVGSWECTQIFHIEFVGWTAFLCFVDGVSTGVCKPVISSLYSNVENAMVMRVVITTQYIFDNLLTLLFKLSSYPSVEQ